MSKESGGYSIGTIIFWMFLLGFCSFDSDDVDVEVYKTETPAIEKTNSDTEEITERVKKSINHVVDEAKSLKDDVTILLQKEDKEDEQNNIVEEREEETITKGKEEIQFIEPLQEEEKEEYKMRKL